MERILAINPGAVSTKFAVFDGDKVVLKKTIEHQAEDLQKFKMVYDQDQYRLEMILNVLDEAGIELKTVNAVVGRGGACMKPMPSGTCAVNAQMVVDLRSTEQGEHASNLGGIIANDLAKRLGVPAFIVDPVTVDELDPVSRISGCPEISRISLIHALNMRAVAHKVAGEIGKEYEDCNFVVAHMGSGGSSTVHHKGRMIDMFDGRDEGFFSPVRAGGVPSYQMMQLCFSGKYTMPELKKKLQGQGGFAGYLGTEDVRQVEKMAAEGNEKADLLLKAFVHQVAKDIGALSTVVSGDVDRIILTGGLAFSKRLVAEITAKVKFIAPVAVVAGEEELEALAVGTLRVLRGEEKAKVYE